MSKRPEEGSNKPAFFKLMVGDFTNSLRIPPAFVRYVYNGNVPERLVLKPDMGKARRVKTAKRDGGWLLGNGWDKFVKEKRLEDGDFVHFRLIDESTFEVFSLGMNGCPKHIKEFAWKYKEDEETVKEDGEPIEVAAAVQKIQKANKPKGIAVPEAEPPSFVLRLKEYEKYDICVPQEIVEATGLKGKREVMVKDPNGRMWPVKTRKERALDRVRLARGWGSFREANVLQPGDTLLLQFVPSTANVINVQILGRAGCRN